MSQEELVSTFITAIRNTGSLRCKAKTIVSDDDLVKLFNKCKPNTIKKDTVLVKDSGSAPAGFYVLYKGSVNVLKQNTPVHAFGKKSCCFGIRGVFTNYTSNVVCSVGDGDALVSFVPRQIFRETLPQLFITATAASGNILTTGFRNNKKQYPYLDCDVAEFRGIRFAIAGRYETPKLLKFASPTDALEHGQVSPQVQLIPGMGPPTGNAPAELFFPDDSTMFFPGESEDCLFLNVFVPIHALSNASKLPVMVWIHGGGFISGCGSEATYDSRELASKGVVVVTINYRLGPLGFLGAIDSDIPLNLGLHDQLCALRWVKENISKFGGDPNTVTAFGESAGAMSVASLLGTQARRDEKLFTRAICQSGGAHTVMTLSKANELADRFAKSLCQEMNIPVDQSVSLLNVKRMKTIPFEIMKRAKLDVITPKIGDQRGEELEIVMCQPIVSSDIATYRETVFNGVHPLTNIARGVASDVALIAGHTKDEMLLFMQDHSWKGKLYDKSKNLIEMKSNFIQLVKGYIETDNSSRFYEFQDIDVRNTKINAFQKAETLVNYFVEEGQRLLQRTDYCEELVQHVWERIHSLWIFKLPVLHLLSIHAGSVERESNANARTYGYVIEAESPNLKSTHAIDLPLVFGTYRNATLASIFTGSGSHVERLSMDMVTSWTNFAKAGKPGADWLPYNDLDKSFRVLSYSAFGNKSMLDKDFLNAIANISEVVSLPSSFRSFRSPRSKI